MSKYLVTGGAGFIGSHTVEALVNAGHRVTVFDNFSTGTRANLDSIDYRKINVVVGDVLNWGDLVRAMDGVDYVIHLAAKVSVVDCENHPDVCSRVNVTGSLNVLRAAKHTAVKRVVLASSSAVYGDTGYDLQVESQLPHPCSVYAASKLAAEHYFEVFNSPELETVVLRYFNVYGPRQTAKSAYSAVIPLFISAMLSDKPIQIYGSGRQTRDFVYVEDVALANILACESAVPGNVFNIGTEKPVSVCKLAIKINEIVGGKLDIEFLPGRQGEILQSLCNAAKFRIGLNYITTTDLVDGLTKTVEYMKKEKKHNE